MALTLKDPTAVAAYDPRLGRTVAVLRDTRSVVIVELEPATADALANALASACLQAGRSAEAGNHADRARIRLAGNAGARRRPGPGRLAIKPNDTTRQPRHHEGTAR